MNAATNQLREQQTYLRGVIESLVDGLITVDPEGVIIDINEQTCRMTGYDRTKLVGSPFRHYFTQPERADLGVKKTIADGVVTNYELVLRTKTGRKATVSLNASLFRGADGRVQGLFVFARDISEQSRLQSELAEQQSYNRSLIEASADAMFAIAPDGVITDVNAEATRLTGYSREHLTDSRFSTYFTDPKRARAGVQETIHEGRVISYELVLITQHGKHIGVSFNAGVFTDATGAILGVLAAARDITERKRAEAHFRGLLESAPEAMVIVNQEGRIILVNSQTEKLFGYDRHELLGQLVELLVPNRHRIDHPAHPLAKFQNPRTRSMGGGQELFGMRQDGTEFPVEVSFSPLETEEGILVIRDITERMLVERTIQEKNIELEKANQAKDRFLTSMSHELRTPLNAIIGFTGTLLMKLPGALNDEQEDQLQTVERSATHLLSLINDLLDLAKIESGNVELNLVSVPCQSVIDEIIGALKPLAQQKQLELASQIPDQEVLVRTDRRVLTQILLNLANNALKFTERGVVHIQLKQYADDEGVITEISVTDSGIGIRSEDQSRLFQAFQQVRGKGQALQQGTGLGLHVSQKLANLLGGQISFESEPGKGSTFTLAIKEQ
ncbi:MAG: PAS domain S-box protein [Planctomycetaceae bacterium]|nr:PAS domain S-box protein [Planctomycetaceae bacterium]